MLKIRQMIRTYYEIPQPSLRMEGKKVEVQIEDHIRSFNISKLMKPREITNENFSSIHKIPLLQQRLQSWVYY